MVTYSIIQKSQLGGAYRLDAEYYQSEYLLVNEILRNKSLQSKTLIDIISRPVVTGSTPKSRDLVGDETDIKFVKTDVVRDGEINFDSADLLPTNASRKNSEPKDGDILITIIGASYEIVGRSARIFADDPKMNINQNIALVRPKEIILSGYLETFLRSKFGRDQLWQQSRQTEQVNLNCREVENILIPILDMKFQNDIDELVNHARGLKLESAEIYKQAENLLLEELGLKDFKPNEDLSFVVNISQVQGANRADADYFQPKYEALISHFKKLARPLKNLATRNTTLARIDPETEYKYIEISDVNTSNGEITANIVMGRDLPANAKMKIYGGELLISKVRPTRGAVTIVPKSWNNDYVASGAFSIFKTESPKREYLQVVMRSTIGKLQLENPTTGTSYPTVTDQDVENILIPIISKSTQQKIADLVKKSHEARKRSKALLEEAKRKVEKMIERGGES